MKALAFLAMIAVLPTAAAQTPVEGCRDQCRPTDADVNPDAPRTTGPVNILLYAHRQDALSRFEMNTQAPAAGIDPELDRGFLMPTLKTSTGTFADFGLGENVFLFQILPSLLEVTENGVRRHQGPLAEPVALGPGPIVLYGYIAVDTVPDPLPRLGAGALPRLHATATWQTGWRIDEGEVFAQGSTGPVDLVALPGRPNVFEIRVPLEARVPQIPVTERERGSVLRLHIGQVDEHGTELGQNSWRIRSGLDFPWRVVLPVQEPLRTQSLDRITENGTAFLRWNVSSPLGAYDVDLDSFRLTVDGADVGPYLLNDHLNYHDGQTKPVSAHWKIPLSDAPQTVQLSVLNLQGTFRLEETLTLPPGLEGSDLPGFDAAFLVLALLGPTLVRRARRF